ncbi:hypothetical protein ITJ66_06850 [Plantibacter sp. VKM Ac-2885]|uniref:hypothetical protein n=1 Tax=Plantibacter sp. VKM Ac-2885 TaxID=2783828 RepID=UPI00188D95C0|nr:hypothetical protein [Plantibacter sp. VKM Ac-2885]MBF4512204.1 hypothetical protein [Plantibacter sp. VKM Ac-2885]
MRTSIFFGAATFAIIAVINRFDVAAAVLGAIVLALVAIAAWGVLRRIDHRLGR